MSLYYSRADIEKVKLYKGGVTTDNSLVYNYVVNPICKIWVNYLPTWLAPNLMTVLGGSCNLLSLLLVVYFDPNMEGICPPWVYLVLCLNMVSYCMLDNMDGKQAFRTGSSSPLGEIFDHGVDSFTVGLGTYVFATVCQTGMYTSLMVSAIGFVVFYLAHWQEYFHHSLELGMLNGPTEAEALGAGIYLATFFLGAGFWRNTFEASGHTLTYGQALVYASAFGAILTTFQSLWTGISLAQKKNISAYKSLTQLIPFTISWICGFIWWFFDPSGFEASPVLWIMGTNLLFSFLVINCIIQRICDLDYRFFYIQIVPYILAALHSVLVHFGNRIVASEQVVLVIFGIYLLNFFHFAITMSGLFCDILKINVWTIPYPNKATKAN